MIALFLLVLILFLSICKPSSKFVAFCALLLMFILYTFCPVIGDYSNYQETYNTVSNSGIRISKEISYEILMFVCGKVGMSFVQFRAILAVIFLGLLYRVVNRMTDKIALALAIFCVCPFPYFASVLRAGIAGLIVANSIHLLDVRKKGNLVKYCLLVLLSMTFHYSSVFYVVFVFTRHKINPIKLGIGIASISVIYYLYRYTSVVTDILSHFTTNTKIIGWMTYSQTAQNLSWKGCFAELCVLIGNVFLTYHFSHFDYRLNEESKLNEKIVKSKAGESYTSIRLLKNINLDLCLLIPVLLVSDVFMRLVWEMIVINVCGWINCVKELGQRARLEQYILIILWIGILMLYISYPYYGTKDSSILFYTENRILGVL